MAMHQWLAVNKLKEGNVIAASELFQVIAYADYSKDFEMLLHVIKIR